MPTRYAHLALAVALFALPALAACHPVVAPAAQTPAATLAATPAESTGATSVDPAADLAAEEMMRAMTTELTTTPWQWTMYAGDDQVITVEHPKQYTVSFHADGTLEVVTDCQRVAGTYAITAGALAITLDNTAAAACPEGSRSAEFLQLLSKGGDFFAMGGGLMISPKDGSGTLNFAADVTTVVDLCGEQAAALNPIESTLSLSVTAELDKRLAAFLTTGVQPAPGVSLLVITPAGRYFKAAGVADVTTCAPLAADSPYEIGSNTKLMTAAMILQLQEEGALSIEDPIVKWLPKLAAELPNGDAITIDMLLRHTSGLYDYFDAEGDGGPISAGIADKAMLTRTFTPVELVERVAASGKSYFAPEERGKFHYSNTGYILLGLIIEAVTGKSYAENLQERIIAPLGLTKTFLLEGQPQPGLLPQAYYSMPFAYTTSEWNASQGWSAGAVVSTAEEFALFLKALFTGQLFRDPATLDLMRGHSDAGRDALGPGTSYGRGMLDNNGVLGHGGQTLGFQSDGGYIPVEDVTIVMWSNSAANDVSRAAVPGLAGVVLASGADAVSPAPTGDSPADAAAALPPYAADLAAAYGPPSQAAFGSAVFYEPGVGDGDLPAAALAKYKYFIGDLWDRYGEEAWMGQWRQVYTRPAGGARDIVAELGALGDPAAAQSASMILDGVDNAAQARAALAAAFDDPAVSEVAVFTLGDGEAMAGLLVAGRRASTGEAIFLVFLLD